MGVPAPDTSRQETEPLAELSLGDALSLAIEAHRAGYLEDAETLYRRILALDPAQADAMHFLGVLLHRRDRSDAAIDLIERSIALNPDMPDRHNNLGNVLVERARPAEAANAYRDAIALAPDHADAWNNLGAVLRLQGRLEEAAQAYQRAIESNPKHADAHNNMGNLLSSLGRAKEAVEYYCKVITLTPKHPESRKLLGIAYYTIGRIDEAAETFRTWVVEEPDNPVARHMYAACSGQGVPARASNAYVEATFDAFSGTFDAKLGMLGYRAPQLVADAVASLCGPPFKAFVVLDAGCGTGLCGPLLAPYASRLIGVDLSGGMLDRARERGVYDELIKAELTEYLLGQHQVFDVIVSADTLVYFGSLEPVIAAAHGALRARGILTFTVEAAADDGVDAGYRINPHGRYSHSRTYVDQALKAAGFGEGVIEPAILRNEGGSGVRGLVVGCRKLAAEGCAAAVQR
jgi:predicted TPR repeat methyltransferase